MLAKSQQSLNKQPSKQEHSQISASNTGANGSSNNPELIENIHTAIGFHLNEIKHYKNLTEISKRVIEFSHKLIDLILKSDISQLQTQMNNTSKLINKDEANKHRAINDFFASLPPDLKTLIEEKIIRKSTDTNLFVFSVKLSETEINKNNKKDQLIFDLMKDILPLASSQSMFSGISPNSGGASQGQQIPKYKVQISQFDCVLNILYDFNQVCKLFLRDQEPHLKIIAGAAIEHIFTQTNIKSYAEFEEQLVNDIINKIPASERVYTNLSQLKQALISFIQSVKTLQTMMPSNYGNLYTSLLIRKLDYMLGTNVESEIRDESSYLGVKSSFNLIKGTQILGILNENSKKDPSITSENTALITKNNLSASTSLVNKNQLSVIVNNNITSQNQRLSDLFNAHQDTIKDLNIKVSCADFAQSLDCLKEIFNQLYRHEGIDQNYLNPSIEKNFANWNLLLDIFALFFTSGIDICYKYAGASYTKNQLLLSFVSGFMINYNPSKLEMLKKLGLIKILMEHNL